MKDKSNAKGSGKGYTVKTYGIDNGAISKFEGHYEKLRKHALAKGVKPPVKGDLVSKMFARVAEILPASEFFKD